MPDTPPADETALEEAAPEQELSADEVTAEHLIDKHGYTKEHTDVSNETHLRLQHTRLHTDETAKHLDHTHEPGEATVLPNTRIWVAIDVAAEGPDAMVIVQQTLSQTGEVAQWRVINPASDADREEFQRVGDDLRRTFEEQGPMEDMFAEEARSNGDSEEAGS